MGEAGSPFQPLLDAHEDFVDKLTELEATLDEMMRTREASEGNREILDESIRFFEEELLPHFVQEDEVVLPPLEAAIGRFGTLVNVVAYEHEEIRREVHKFEDARRELDSRRDPWPAIEELNRHGIFTIQFLWDHFRKERTGLFPAALQKLTGPQLEGIRERLARA
ncbi:MAG TPA: hemerythrin domain-containing protein [Thermoplasmata archaeon]|nr:hemerythrin domain-containing protein [Thermoplasmata archaeon]